VVWRVLARHHSGSKQNRVCIPPIPNDGNSKGAGETLRGPITREDFEWQIGQLRRGRAVETQTAGSAAREPRVALRAIPLTRDGTVPLDSTCPAFREATLGPAGSYLTHTGVVVATDGSVKDDGRMGAAYVALDNRLPPRSFV
jgi:hypothetical protein